MTTTEMKKFLRKHRPRVHREGYPEHARARAVAFAAEQGGSVRMLSENLGLGKETLSDWIKQADKLRRKLGAPKAKPDLYLVTDDEDSQGTTGNLQEALDLAGGLATEGGDIRVWREVPTVFEHICKIKATP